MHHKQLPPHALFTIFYIQHADVPRATPEDTPHPKQIIIPPPLYPASPLPDVPDIAATNAEVVFWEVIKILKGDEQLPNDDTVNSFWPPQTLDTGDESGEE